MLLDGRIRGAGAKGRAGHVVASFSDDALAQTFVVGKEEGFVLQDRAADIAAKLIQTERLLLEVERVARVQCVVAQELEERSRETRSSPTWTRC